MKKVFFFLIPLFFFFAYNLNALQAPSNFRISGYNLANSQTTILELSWLQTNLEGITFYKLYKAEGQTEDINNFSLLATFTPNFDSIVNNRLAYVLNSVYLQPGTYSFFLKSANENQESERSNIKVIQIAVQTPQIIINFTSEPILTAQVGQLYQYDVNAVASDNGEVHYALIEPPAGMTIDSITGLITWIPQEPGIYRNITVKAYHSQYPNKFKTQKWNITVTYCQQIPVIIGEVHNQNNELVSGVRYTIYKFANDTLIAVKDGIITQGLFTAVLDSGTYYIKFSGSNIITEWWENSETFDNATPIELACGDTVYLNVFLNSAPQREIIINSSPNTQAYVGIQYQYQVTAYSPQDSNAVIRYAIIKGPDGMTINEVTGLITWTPLSAGVYEVSVKAFFADNPNSFAKQSFTIRVFACTLRPVVVGYVVFPNGQPVSGAEVTAFYFRDSLNQNKIQFASAPVQDGVFYLELDQGTFYLLFEGQNIQREWWEDAVEIGDATPINLECGDSLIIEVHLQPREIEQFYTVSGTVISAENEEPIPFAVIEFLGYKNNNQQVNAVLKEVFRTYAYNGQYSINLSNKYSYKAFCVALSDSNANSQAQYLPQFYNQVSDATLATFITLTGNRDDINFVLAPKPDYENGLIGYIRNAENQPVVNALVVAYLVQPVPWNPEYLYISYTCSVNNEQGQFQFTNLIPGNYIIYVIPGNPNLVPGYYRVNTFTVFNWREATNVPVASSGIYEYEIIVKVRNAQRFTGNGLYRGHINRRGNSIQKSDYTFGNNEPVNGASVYAIDNYQSVNVYNFDISKENGAFVLDNLPKGSYMLIVDRIGYDPYVEIFSITDEITTIDKEIEINESTTLNIEPETRDNQFYSIYPNPASDKIFIILKDANVNEFTYSILDNMGRVVKSGNVLGTNFADVSVQNMTSGLYYIKILAGNNTKVIPLIIAK